MLQKKHVLLASHQMLQPLCNLYSINLNHVTAQMCLLAECLLLQCKENVHAAGESVSLFADTTRRLLIMAQCNLLQAARGALACCQTYCQDFVPKTICCNCAGGVVGLACSRPDGTVQPFQQHVHDCLAAYYTSLQVCVA